MGSCLSTDAAVITRPSAHHGGQHQHLNKSNPAAYTNQDCAPTIHLVTTQSSQSGGEETTTETTGRSRDEDDDEEQQPTSAGGANPKILPRTRHSPVGLDMMVEARKSEGHLVSNVVNIEESVLGGRRIEQEYNGVRDGKELGRGVAGVVRLVKHRGTGIPYAVKCLELARVGESPAAQQQLRNEITIMSQLDHPNIARLHEVYEDESQIYLVQELGEGGELFDDWDEQPDGYYTEADAVRLVYQMLSALRYLHSKGIIHRDLKLENFLFSTKRHAQLKMIDFGLSKHFYCGEVQHEIVGTPYTVAPEVISGNYDEKCDMWAIGVLAFMLLSGDAPFGGCGGPETMPELRANILGGRRIIKKKNIWGGVSSEAKDFVRQLLVTDPNLRPSAEQAQQHSWIRVSQEARIDQAVVSPEIVKALLSFKDLPVAKRLMFEVVSFTMLPDQIRNLHVEFEKMDTDGLGEISLDCMNQVLKRQSSPQQEQALSETEIREIFDALKVGKSEPRVHWHEFVAACLSTCPVDERNIRIAFDRLDQDHVGYITFEGVIRLIARDANENEDALRRTWADSVAECHCKHARFNFEDFSHLVHKYI